MTRLLITGAAGFLGANLIRKLADRLDIQTMGWVRPGSNLWRLAGVKNAEISAVDITSASDVTAAMERDCPDILINAATYGVAPTQRDMSLTYNVNVHGAYLLMSAAKAASCSRFLQIGSFFEYGTQSSVLHEDAPLCPISTYAATKAAASLLATGFECTKVEIAVLRLFNLWGPWESPHRLVPQIFEACRNNTPLALTTGTQQKDFVFAADAASWIIELALRTSPLGFPIINVANGAMTEVRTFVTEISNLLGCSDLMRFGEKPLSTTEPQSGPADTTRLDSLLPQRKITSVADAVYHLQQMHKSA